MNEDAAGGWRWQCPVCGSGLARQDDLLRCIADGLTFPRTDGIWRLLAPGRERYFSKFLGEYRQVRQMGGWGSEQDSYYLALPHVPRGTANAAIWRHRARSLSALQRVIRQTRRKGRLMPLAILDLGAGNGWLSYRLAQQGHRVVALDINLDRCDGLGAQSRYVQVLAERMFISVQAEYAQIPLAAGQCDWVIYNASLHYASDYAATLAEGLRVLKPHGRLVIMDSPIYRNQQSGERMRAQRKEQTLRRFGFASDTLGSREFLTEDDLGMLAEVLHLRWSSLTPWYGLRWALAPVRAWLRRRREPARMRLLIATRKDEQRDSA